MTAFACCVNARRQPARPATPAERPATPARHPRQGLDGSDLEPQLAHTLPFTRCAAVAERLLGRPVEHRFDHAIYKPAFNGAATSWHQDEAYALERKILSAHFWVPLQDVTRDMGCMEFIPGGPGVRSGVITGAIACATRTRWSWSAWTRPTRCRVRSTRATRRCTFRARSTIPGPAGPARRVWRGRSSSVPGAGSAFA